MKTQTPEKLIFGLTTMHPVYPERFCLSIEEENDDGVRIGGFTDDKLAVYFARSALEEFVQRIETDDPQIRKHVEAMLARRQAHIEEKRTAG